MASGRGVLCTHLIPQPMKKHVTASLATLLLIVPSILGQTSPAAPAANDTDTVVLTPFTVTAEQIGRYTSTQATSGGRVAVDLFSVPQSMSVVTREVIEDVAAGRVLDAAKYVSGITESTIPDGLDRITIRGFQTDGQTVDGFRSNTQANLDPVFIERLEVVKGPSAILAPSGIPGGTINAVSRKPQFGDFGSFSASIGIYDGPRGELDYNRVLGTEKNMAFRVVAAGQNTTDGWRGHWNRVSAAMPMLTYQTRSGAQLTLQAQLAKTAVQNDLGLPIDPSSSPTTGTQLLSGVSRTLNTSDGDYRHETHNEFRALLTAPLTEALSTRLAVRYLDQHVDFSQNLSGGGTGGATNPLTGLFTPGFAYGPAPTFTASAATPESRILNRGGQVQPTDTTYFDAQNDYAHKFSNSFLKATTLVGWAYDNNKSTSINYVTSKPAINFDAPVAATYTIGTKSNYTVNTFSTEQAYISEAVSVWDDRLALSGNYSYNNYDLSVINRLTKVSTIANVDTSLKSWGVVLKPIPTVAAYYGYSEIATPNDATTIASGGVPLQIGSQREVGLRFQSPNKRLYATLAHFDVLQTNYGVPNPANLTVPPPNPLLPSLVSDRKAKGWELEVRTNLTDQLSVIGNWTKFTNRDPNNVPFRGTAEESWAFLTD